ncbi:hypothetical protein L7F22_049943 [Adiantum nelumboides]|nr:hypothetical protein [Adiantum nelumboides]
MAAVVGAAAEGARVAARGEQAWRALFANPSEWWDYRSSKSNPNYPDFRHKASREPLWLDNPFKPSWVDSLLPSFPIHLDLSQFHSVLHHGDLYQALQLLSSADPLLSQGMYLSLFKACNRSKSLALAKLIFNHVSSRRLPLSGLFGDSLVVTLAKCGALEEARELFFSLSSRTVYSWTAMISGYTNCGKSNEALLLYTSMLEEGVEPNACTFVTVLKACGNLMHLEEGRRLHADARDRGLTSNVFVASSLVSMFGKCGDVVQAETVFGEMQEPDDVAWCGMLSAYLEGSQAERALLMYRQMNEEGVKLSRLPLVFAIQACCMRLEEEKWQSTTQCVSVKAVASVIGRALHADARREGVASDGFIGSTLVNFYSKLKASREAEAVCGGLVERDVVAWSAMLSAYVEHGQAEKALQLFVQMQLEGVSPNRVTFLFAFQACGILADREDAIMVTGCAIKVVSLEIGKALHVDAKCKGFTTDDVVGSSLVSMYGKCGAVLEAEAVFNELPECDIVAWTAMLSAYLQEGSQRKALQFSRRMQKEGVVFTDIALANVLQSCRGSGSLELVRQLHFTAVSSLEDESRLFWNTLVHAYGTCASLVDARAVFDSLSQPDVVAWTNCIAAYSQEGMSALCSDLFNEMQLSGLKPDNVTFLFLLSAFRHAGLVPEAVGDFQSMSREFGMAPALKHYAVIVDLMARAGNLKGVKMMLQGMPEQADACILLGLLGSCLTHGNLEFGKLTFGNAVNIQPTEVSAYILMSNLYATAEVKDGAIEE